LLFRRSAGLNRPAGLPAILNRPLSQYKHNVDRDGVGEIEGDLNSRWKEGGDRGAMKTPPSATMGAFVAPHASARSTVKTAAFLNRRFYPQCFEQAAAREGSGTTCPIDPLRRAL